tara:strand:- start:2331 stop:2627 length:297 start_codon:yes stop_codon:yes gene_type:complete
MLLLMREHLCRVVTATAKGVTATDALKTFETPTPRAVLGNRVEHVLAARGLEATVSAHEVPKRRAVGSDHEIDQPDGNGIDDPHQHHDTRLSDTTVIQ